MREPNAIIDDLRKLAEGFKVGSEYHGMEIQVGRVAHEHLRGLLQEGSPLTPDRRAWLKSTWPAFRVPSAGELVAEHARVAPNRPLTEDQVLKIEGFYR